MKLLMLLVAVSSFMAAQDSVCQKREYVCVQRCNEAHAIGSMDHLNCKYRCYEDYLSCRQEP